VLTGILISVAATLLAAWLLLITALIVGRAKGVPLTEGLRLLPDVLRLLRRLAADRTLPRAVRARAWIALAWLLSPIDLIPEFIPVIGPADDIIVVTILLRSLIRHAGPEAVQRHWPGTPQGLAVLARLCKLPIPASRPAAPLNPARDQSGNSPPQPRPPTAARRPRTANPSTWIGSSRTPRYLGSRQRNLQNY
jgi:uncharacterized membrane protein YkvA (DUF1232 family)